MLRKIPETYLNRLLKECKYLVNSTKSFKAKFSVQKEKFDVEKHEIRCLDIKSLYLLVNVNRTISFILDLLNAEPKKFFP